MAPSPTRDSTVSPCFRGFPAFLHRHFPPQSPPSHPLDPSLHRQQPSPWDYGIIPKLQLLAAAPSRGPASLSEVCMAVQGLSDSHSLQAATDQLFHSDPKMFLLWLRLLPQCGDWTPVSVPLPAEGRSSPTNMPIFPPQLLAPTEFWMVLYILFCWSGTPVHAQLVFCMHFCV